jgi:hypothetical protein
MEGMPLMMVLSVKCTDEEGKPNGALPKCLTALNRCLAENHAHFVGDPLMVEDRIHIEVDFDSEESVIRFGDLIPGIPLGTIEVLVKEQPLH